MADFELLPLVGRADVVRAGADDRALRVDVARGTRRRVRRGVFAAADDWSAADFDRRYLAEIAAVVATRRSEVVLSHRSAAAVWGLPSGLERSKLVHLADGPTSGRRSKNGVMIHRTELAPGDVVTIGEFRVTSLSRTLADLCRDAPFLEAVVALDAAFDVRRPLLERSDVARHLDEHPGRSPRRAERALAFASGLAMNPLESVSRGVIHELGFPPPVEQYEVVVRGGTRRKLDFWWPEYRVAGEADGRAKYSIEGDPEHAVWQEKVREFELLDYAIRFTRWGWADCTDRRRLATRLLAAGLPRLGVPLGP